MGGYCDHVAKVSGRDIVAEKLGLIRNANNQTIAVPVVQDADAEDFDFPEGAPTGDAYASPSLNTVLL